MADVSCSSCGASLPQVAASKPQPCPDCGSDNRLLEVDVHDEVSVHDQVRLKKRDPDGLYEETVSGADRHRNTGEWRDVQRLVDHRNDWYDEVVRRPDGEVVREVHEPLSEHQGRGSAGPQPPVSGA